MPDRRPRLPFRMLGDAVAHLPGQVQPAALVLEHVDDAQALLVVVEAAGHQPIDDPLPGVTERRVPEIVAERNRLGQLLVEPEDLRDRPRDLRHLERVREPRPIVIAGRRKEDLRLVFEPAERLAVDDPVAVALERRPDIVFALRPQTSARIGALRRLRSENLAFPHLELFAERSVRGCHAESWSRARAARPRTFQRASARDRRRSGGCRGRCCRGHGRRRR